MPAAIALDIILYPAYEARVFSRKKLAANFGLAAFPLPQLSIYFSAAKIPLRFRLGPYRLVFNNRTILSYWRYMLITQ